MTVKFKAPQPPMIAARSFGGDQDPRGGIIRLHSTVSPCQPGQARAVAEFFHTETNPTSAHYVVDCGQNDHTVQCVPDHRRSYDCGWNPPGISIEMCEYPDPSNKKRWDDKPHRQLEANAVALVAQLCLAYDIRPYFVSAAQLKRGIKGVTTHAEVQKAFPSLTTHWDPGAWRRYRFMRAVRAQIKTLTKEAAK